MAQQVIKEAIETSKATTDIALIDEVDVTEAVLAELREECEDEAESDVAYEFWGKDCDGNEWRVHARK